MGLTLSARLVDGHIIVEAAGQIEAGESCMRLQEFAKRLISGGERLLVIDMAAISYIDSAGIGSLLSIYTTLRIQSGELKLLNAGPPVKEALVVTNLMQIFDVCETEKPAAAKKS